MVTQSKTFTASEIGLMRGFPPPPDKRVTHDNQLLSPYTRWSFQNSLKLNCAAEVWRGNQPVAEMEYALRDLHNVSYQDWSGDSQQIVPRAVIEDIEQGGDPDAFARGSAASPMSEGYSYHHQWWIAPNVDAYYALGYAGQHLYIQPKAQLVVAKFASYPVSEPNGEEFYSAFAAFPVLVQAMIAKRCRGDAA